MVSSISYGKTRVLGYSLGPPEVDDIGEGWWSTNTERQSLKTKGKGENPGDVDSAGGRWGGLDKG